MAAADRFTEKLACTCGAQVTIHWLDYGYRDSKLRLEHIVGYTIKRKTKRPLQGGDCIDFLCGHCGTLLHESEGRV